jgi:bifunctional ADP-heptose synthase (sugar kinase/adenylyltransferase)
MTDLNAIQQQTRYKILLIGDNCIDVYRYGTVDRISPEAPVPVFKFEKEEQCPGMAGNVKLNLEALGCEVDFFTSKEPSIKTRIIDKRSKQHLLRIDEDVEAEPIDISKIADLNHYDAVIISDYNKGTITYDNIDQIRKDYQGLIFMDTKKSDLACFYNIFVKINELEYNNCDSINNSLIITLGSRGAMYKTGRDPKHETVYPCPAAEVVDVTGAGDTFLAAFAFEFLRSYNHGVAIDFANRASSITVQHLGCYAPKLEEIR